MEAREEVWFFVKSVEPMSFCVDLKDELVRLPLEILRLSEAFRAAMFMSDGVPTGTPWVVRSVAPILSSVLSVSGSPIALTGEFLSTALTYDEQCELGVALSSSVTVESSSISSWKDSDESGVLNDVLAGVTESHGDASTWSCLAGCGVCTTLDGRLRCGSNVGHSSLPTTDLTRSGFS